MTNKDELLGKEIEDLKRGWERIFKEDCWDNRLEKISFDLGKKEAELKGRKEAKEEMKKEFEMMIENERVYPDYRDFTRPAEAITQFKVRLKQKIQEMK